ncbi:MAG: hypothetical protein WC556_09390 [Candidatus Methanoperedens sp.]
MNTEITQENPSPPIKERRVKYLFSWDETTKKDNSRFLKFLQNFGVKKETVKIEKVENSIDVFSEKNHLSFSLNNEKTKATLKINDFKTYEYTAKMENGQINIYPKPKIRDLVDKWSLPINKYNLKIWIHSPSNIYYQPSIGIGLGTISKPDIFSFAIMDDNSLHLFENALKESLEIYKKEKSTKENEDRLILWDKNIELDKLRKISIGLSVLENKGNKSINLMVNSKASLYTVLYPDDVEWILMILSIAKHNLETKYI